MYDMAFIARWARLAFLAPLIFVHLARADFFTDPAELPADSEVITFETGSTGLPSVPGVTFVREGSSSSPPWFDGSGSFSGFFESQGWSNLVSSSYSDLALEFDTAVETIGAWVGRIPNFTGEHPSHVDFELFDRNWSSLGATSVALPAAFDSPVFVGFHAATGVVRAEWRGNDSGFFGVDNVTFSLVPEPVGMASLASGALLVLIAYRRPRPATVMCVRRWI